MSDTATDLSILARETLELETETFEITDYTDANEVLNASTCSSTSSSCCKGAK